MAIIYSYPKVTTPLATDVLVLTDTTLVKGGKRKNQTKSLALSDLAAYVVSSTSGITGGGTLNKIPLWTPDGFKLGDSILRQDAVNDIVYVGPEDSVRFTGTSVNAPVFTGTDLFVSNITSGPTGVVTIQGNAIIGDQATDTLIVNSTLTVEGVTTFNAEVECSNNVTVQGVFAADGNSVFSGSLTIDEQLIDGTGSSGTAGQVLSSIGTGVEWINSTVPNLPIGRLFVGTATNTSLASDVVYVDDTNNRVGIRTAFPQVAFHVDGAIRVRGDLQVSQQNNNTFVGENMPDLTVVIGSNNTALGDSVMPGATSASFNTGIGALSLSALIVGNNNTAIGTNSMALSNGGSLNTALGSDSLNRATAGQGNTAIGYFALYNKTTSNFNTAVGIGSLAGITTGFRNTAVGNKAGRFISDGAIENATGRNSVFIGDSAKANADNQTNQIVIGYDAIGNGANTATIGNTATTVLHVGGDNTGIVLKSPNGTAYTIRVTDAGALVVT